jgi:hypothetical protein
VKKTCKVFAISEIILVMDFFSRVLQRTESWVAPLKVSVRSREELDLLNGFGDSKSNPRLTM